MIELDVPDEELTQRLLKRGEISGRSDDNAETIQKRLNVYHQLTEPLMQWYQQEGIRHQVEGTGTIYDIFGRITNVIDNI
jgi:adenylate kinase